MLPPRLPLLLLRLSRRESSESLLHALLDALLLWLRRAGSGSFSPCEALRMRSAASSWEWRLAMKSSEPGYCPTVWP